MDIAPKLGGSSKQGGQNKIGAGSNGNSNANQVPFIGTLLSTSSEMIFAKWFKYLNKIFRKNIFLLVHIVTQDSKLHAFQFKLLNVFHLTLSWRRSLSYRNQSMICRANQETGFYTVGASIMREISKMFFYDLSVL